MSKKINHEDLTKALSALEDLSKGHNSRGTAATKVDAMEGEGPATQVFHTPSDSDPGSWAGTTEKESPDNGATDAIEENGTDYKGGAEMVKSVLEMIAKGEISPEAGQKLLAKGGMPFGKEDDKEDEEKAKKGMDKDEDDKEMEKSLHDFARENTAVQEGFEMSSFLTGWSEAIGKSLQSVESRLEKSVVAGHERQASFNDGLVKALSDLGVAVSAIAQRVEQVEAQPAHAPRSVMAGVNVVEKSLAGSGDIQFESLTKSQVSGAMESLVKSGEIEPFEVLRFDASPASVSPGVKDAVINHIRKNS